MRGAIIEVPTIGGLSFHELSRLMPSDDDALTMATSRQIVKSRSILAARRHADQKWTSAKSTAWLSRDFTKASCCRAFGNSVETK